uniref:Uncharacterized protein n=1 Tax=Vespula pensylvanica TaxID=30213 RepID=A0A834PAU8_VESPE|nr:hypothetical protein H0235_002774 [Vespula pensylvanica]
MASAGARNIYERWKKKKKEKEEKKEEEEEEEEGGEGGEEKRGEETVLSGRNDSTLRIEWLSVYDCEMSEEAK